jgi:Ribbon-helix-helix protein, copG family
MGERRTERLTVTLSSEEIAAIDEFRLHARIPTRPAAVRELLKRGLYAQNRPPQNAKGD